MAKKRKVRRKALKKATFVKLKRPFKIADVLVSTAIWFLLIVSILSIIFANVTVDKVAELGISIEASSIYLTVLLWLILASLAYASNKLVKANFDKHQMWGLLIVGILMALSAFISPTIVISPATLIMIAALIYLVKSK